MRFGSGSKARNEAATEKECSPRISVLLTGSTGTLGTYLLDLLLDHPRVERIVCLNRSGNSRQRQEESLKSRGLRTLPSTGVDFFEADLSHPTIGLEPSLYHELLGTISAVLHNGWLVNFNHTFSSFEPSIQGVKNLIRFSHDCRYVCPIFFISSISVASNWGAVPGAQKQVPEIELDDWRLARVGYGQSKLVAETLLAEAARISRVPVSICRVCQVGGPVLHGLQGAWNEREWVPNLVATSQKLKALPATLGPADLLDWIPMDLLARSIVELFEASNQQGVAEAKQSRLGFQKASRPASVNIFHVSNPLEVSWATVLPVLQAHLGNDTRIVSLPEWVDLLSQSASSPAAADIPGLKLMDFFENLQDKAIRFPRAMAATLETRETRKLSPTLNTMDAVQPEWMDIWLRQWKAKGFLEG